MDQKETNYLLSTPDPNYNQFSSVPPACDNDHNRTSFRACLLFVCWPFLFISQTLTETAGLLRRRYHSKASSLTTRNYCLFALFLTLYTVASAAQFFGQNFWLSSFIVKGAPPTFVTLLIPSAIWALLNILLVFAYKFILRPTVSLSFWQKSKSGIFMLILIGISDAFAGLSSTYSVPHVPALLQTACYASGSIVVYIVHRIAYRETAVPLSFLLMISFAFLLVGVVCAVIPTVLQGNTSLSTNPGWAAVFFLSILLPAIYNVFQGKFLGLFSDRKKKTDVPQSNEYRDTEREALLSTSSSQSMLTRNPNIEPVAPTSRSPPLIKAPHEACMLVVLTADYWVQLFVTAIFFLPMDALPWFGSSQSVSEAWQGFIAGCHCIWWDCSADYNFPYMLLYVLGFWVSRALLTLINVYSPTAASLIAQATAPITNFMLMIFPAWNLFGAPVNVGYTLGCFFASIMAALIFFAVNESSLQRAEEVAALEAKEKHSFRDAQSPNNDLNDASPTAINTNTGNKWEEDIDISVSVQ